MYVCGVWRNGVWGVRVGGGMVCGSVECGGMCDKYPCRCLGTTVAVL